MDLNGCRVHRDNTNLAQNEVMVYAMFQRRNLFRIMILGELAELTYENTIDILGQASLGSSLCLLE